MSIIKQKKVLILFIIIYLFIYYLFIIYYILIDSIFSTGKNHYPQVFSKKCEYVIKEKNDS